jgi:hypothetical protein
MDVASKQVPIILACEAGGGLDRVVIREGEKGCRRATHVSTWPAQSDVAGDTAYLRACKRSYATWTSGPAICHLICVSELRNVCFLSPSHHFRTEKSTAHASTSARQHFSIPETRYVQGATSVSSSARNRSRADHTTAVTHLHWSFWRLRPAFTDHFGLRPRLMIGDASSSHPDNIDMS